MHCPHCNQEHPDDSQFCPNTGREILKPAQQEAQGAGTARTPGRSPRSSKTRRGLPTVVWLIIIMGVFCALVIAAAVLGLAIWNSLNQAKVIPTGTFQPATSGEAGGRIAFVSDRDGNSEIYVMDADGSHQTRLTYTSKGVHNDYPVWSPDGQKIAFVSDRGGNPEIYVMNADGSDPTLLRNIPVGEFPGFYYTTGDLHPAWAPDGQKLAFVSDLDGDYKICVMNADGSDPACLPGSQVGGVSPSILLQQEWTTPEFDQIGVAWSADGQTIVYSSKRSGNSKIYAINTDGSVQTALSNERDEFSPTFSADGLKIAFVSTRDGRAEIYVMKADGSAQTALTNKKQATSGSPSWSADGRRIVFQSDRDGNSEIYVMNADGSHQTRLTDNQAQDWNPDWSPVTFPAFSPMVAPTPTVMPYVWSSSGLNGGPILALVIDPKTPAKVYAGTSSGAFKSTDGGGSWNAVPGLTNLTVFCLAIDPQIPATLYAGTNEGVFKSTDGGGNWMSVNTGLHTGMPFAVPPDYTVVYQATSVYSLAIDPATTATLYAGTSGGVFKSTGGGESWSKVYDLFFVPYAALPLAIDPATPTTLYAGIGDRVLKSTDAGKHWLAGDNALYHVNTLVIDPATPATLYAGTDRGVYKSLDGGDTWGKMNPDLTGVTTLAIDPATPTTLYAGTDSGVFKSTDGGNTWTEINASLVDVTSLAIDPATPTTLYVGTALGVFKGTNSDGN